MFPQIAEIILIKKPLIDAETKLRKKHFPGVGRERGAAHPAHAVLLATNHETVEVKVAPIECDLEQVVQHGDAAVAGHVQTPPYRRVDLEEQDVELVNFGRSVWLDHSRPRSLVVALFSPQFFPVTHDLVIIQITWNEGRNPEQKKALYKAIADGLHSAVGLRREDVLINLVEVKKENWSYGNGIAQYAV
jgi:phenylpyruvate tautomerase PptA (4-oxalocrotonate tautomerase family)